MARKEVIQYIDDFDGKVLESSDVETVEYTWKGAHYVIDLSRENADLFSQQMDEWIQYSHRVARHSNKFQPKKSSRTDMAEIRAWARDNGYEVSDRGRIPRNVTAEFDRRKRG